MTTPRTTRTTSLTATVLALIPDAARCACVQQRTTQRLLILTMGLILAVGRQTLTGVLVTIGAGDRDWSAAYRLFRTPSVTLDALRRTLLAQILATIGRTGPLVVVLDGTHLPRTGRRMPGVGWAKALASPPWKPGIQRAQRWVGLSILLPRSAQGATRAVPLWFDPAPSPKATPWPDRPPRTEWEAGRDALHWLRTQLEVLGQGSRRILVVADGSYAVAPLIRSLPPHTVLLARCAKNRALFALPDPPALHQKGRRRCYGAQGDAPQTQLHAPRAVWTTTSVRVRGRSIPLTARVTGPWLVKPAPRQPVFVLVVTGVDRVRHGHPVHRDPTFWLVTAVVRRGQWVLPDSAPALLAWAWQRWEVEVMHRELKGGFGLGQQQAFRPTSAAVTPAWVAWTYGTLMLAGYQAWGWEHDAPRHAWSHPRRWTARDLVTAIRAELWTELAQPFPDVLATFLTNRPESPPSLPPGLANLAAARRL